MTGAGVELLVEPWELGIRKAKEFLLTGDTIDAQEAWRLGLVNQVVPRAELAERTRELAERIALVPPVTAQVVKDTINHTGRRSWASRTSWKYHFMAHHWVHNTATALDALAARQQKGSMKEVFAERDRGDERPTLSGRPSRGSGSSTSGPGSRRRSAPDCSASWGPTSSRSSCPGQGDFMRTMGPFVAVDGGPTTRCPGRSKVGDGEGVTCDLRHAEGQDLFRRLADRRPTWCARTSVPAPWRNGASVPTTLDPRLVYVRISVFGQDGPVLPPPRPRPSGHRLRRAAPPDR